MIEKTAIAFTVGEKDHYGRVFTREALEQAVEDFQGKVNIAHGCIAATGPTPKLETISHTVENLYMDGDEVKVEIKILDTDAGKIAQELVKAGNELEISYVCSTPVGAEDLEELQIIYLNIDFPR